MGAQLNATQDSAIRLMEKDTELSLPVAVTKKSRASWYGTDFDGKQTACGEEYDMYDFTAA